MSMLGRLAIILVLVSNVANANESFYKDRERGWHWYEQKAKEPEEKDVEQKSPEMTATEQVEAIRQDAKEKLHKAMIEPTEDNMMEA